MHFTEYYAIVERDHEIQNPSERYLRWERRYLGWAIFVARPGR